jgi:hypothetical protein
MKSDPVNQRVFLLAFHPHGARVSPLLDFFVMRPDEEGSQAFPFLSLPGSASITVLIS